VVNGVTPISAGTMAYMLLPQTPAAAKEETPRAEARS
jgi:hypothetical protein